MKKVFVFYTVFLYLTFCSCVSDIKASEPYSTKEFKVMVWNIWQGGKGERLPKDDARQDIIDIIKKSKADVILMIETYGAAPMIADALKYNYQLISNNLCVFSKYPIVETYTFPDSISTFNFGGVKIMMNNDMPMVFFNTWLHYLPDTRLVPTNKKEKEILAWENTGSREDEIKTILKTIKSFRYNSDKIPIIMGGDFNSYSHLDWTEATKNLYNHGGAVVNWTISSAMKEAGFIDSYRKVKPNPVLNPGTTWLPARNAEGELSYTRQDRIDFIYYKGKRLSVKESIAVVAPDGNKFEFKGKNFMFPSDHGFVLTTFNYRP